MPQVRKMVLADSASQKLAKLRGMDYVLSELNKSIIAGLTADRAKGKMTLDTRLAQIGTAAILELMIGKGCSMITVTAEPRRGISTYTFKL